MCSDVWLSRFYGNGKVESVSPNEKHKNTFSEFCQLLGVKYSHTFVCDIMRFRKNFAIVPTVLSSIQQKLNLRLNKLFSEGFDHYQSVNGTMKIDFFQSEEVLFKGLLEAFNSNDNERIEMIGGILRFMYPKEPLLKATNCVPLILLFFARQNFLYGRKPEKCCEVLLRIHLDSDKLTAEQCAQVVIKDIPLTVQGVKNNVVRLLGQLLTEVPDLNLSTLVSELKARLKLIEDDARAAYKAVQQQSGAEGTAPKSPKRIKQAQQSQMFKDRLEAALRKAETTGEMITNIILSAEQFAELDIDLNAATGRKGRRDPSAAAVPTTPTGGKAPNPPMYSTVERKRAAELPGFSLHAASGPSVDPKAANASNSAHTAAPKTSAVCSKQKIVALVMDKFGKQFKAQYAEQSMDTLWMLDETDLANRKLMLATVKIRDNTEAKAWFEKKINSIKGFVVFKKEDDRGKPYEDKDGPYSRLLFHHIDELANLLDPPSSRRGVEFGNR